MKFKGIVMGLIVILVLGLTMAVVDARSTLPPPSITPPKIPDCDGSWLMEFNPNPLQPSTAVKLTSKLTSYSCNSYVTFFYYNNSEICNAVIDYDEIQSLDLGFCNWVSPDTTGNYIVSAYIDRNRDGDFTDPGEANLDWLFVNSAGALPAQIESIPQLPIPQMTREQIQLQSKSLAKAWWRDEDTTTSSLLLSASVDKSTQNALNTDHNSLKLQKKNAKTNHNRNKFTYKITRFQKVFAFNK